jgi:hypothetical protein
MQRFAELRAKYPDLFDIEEPLFMAAISDVRVNVAFGMHLSNYDSVNSSQISHVWPMRRAHG